MDGQQKIVFSFSWRWVLAAYCYLVIFHLLPTYLMSGATPLQVKFAGQAESGLKPSDLATVWLLAGIAAVAFVVGWKSEGSTLFEPAVAGLLYVFTTALGFGQLITARVKYETTLAVIFWFLIVVIVSVGSAWIGEVVQRRRGKKNV